MIFYFSSIPNEKEKKTMSNKLTSRLSNFLFQVSIKYLEITLFKFAKQHKEKNQSSNMRIIIPFPPFLRG